MERFWRRAIVRIAAPVIEFAILFGILWLVSRAAYAIAAFTLG